jgi:hypothetical protein
MKVSRLMQLGGGAHDTRCAAASDDEIQTVTAVMVGQFITEL